jgi:hypothetical protein
LKLLENFDTQYAEIAPKSYGATVVSNNKKTHHPEEQVGSGTDRQQRQLAPQPDKQHPFHHRSVGNYRLIS